MTLRSTIATLITVFLLVSSGAGVGFGQRAPATVQLGAAGLEPGGFPRAKSTGIRAVKIIADWSVIEARRGQPVWTDLDRSVAAATAESLTPVVVLTHTPQWASIGTGLELQQPAIYTRQPPRDPRDWERFVGAVADRYRGRVREWQVWTQLGLPAFRGTGMEYVTLLQGARGRIRATDPGARVAMATPGGVDLTFVIGVLTGAADAFDVITLSPQGLSPEALLRPLAVLGARLRGTNKAVWIDWTPEFGTTTDRMPGAWARMHAVANAAGVERLFVSDLAGADVGIRQVTAVLGTRAYAGHLQRDPGVFVTVFGSAPDALALAWTRGETRSLELSPAGEIRVTTIDGQAQSPEVRENRAVVRVGEAPVVIKGLPAAVVEEARTNVSGGPLLPRPGAERDYSKSADVSAKLGKVGQERGLYNLPYRGRRNGAVEPVEIEGVEAVRTNVARDVIYLYFDVDDTFMYFAEGRATVTIVVEVRGARASRQLGFNVLYDSTTGYRFSPWQWVEPGEGWTTQTIQLTDASFANTWGWDFAINAAGNRAEDLTVRAVTVRKGAP
ncbi:MAG: hypothetical protein ACT4PY_02660 [Armatimonadota bacterium]